MLNRVTLLSQIQHIAHKLFVHPHDQFATIFALWAAMIDNPTLATLVAQAQAPWPLPSWQGLISTFIEIPSTLADYTIFSVDGSQIYPDRHQGTPCFLINIGSVIITYGNFPGIVTLRSQPYPFIEDPRTQTPATHDAVDSLRQEYELLQGIALARSHKYRNNNTILLFDGTLIFWHLDTKDPCNKEYYLPRYCQALVTMATHQIPTASYISLPRSRELVNLIRFVLCAEGTSHDDANKMVAHITDTLLLARLLPKYTRTIVFTSNSPICAGYPEQVKPHFWYINVGSEIARIEAPAWVARDSMIVDMISTVVIDQCIKGRGYPVVLAEAHEQAVIKSADRDFFYHCIRKLSIEHQQQMMPSQKSVKKRGLGI